MNKKLKGQIAQAAVDTVTEVDLRIEGAAKGELYPGHGKVTGALQRSITGAPGTLQGSMARGRVSTKGIKYAKRIHRLYHYLTEGVIKVRPMVPAIFARKMKERVQ